MKIFACATVAAGLLAAAFLVPANAQDAKPEDAVKYRLGLMSVVGGHTGNFFSILQGKVPHKDALAYNADALAAASKQVKAAFAQNTAGSGVKTESKDAIWAAGSDFNKHADDFEKAAVALASAVQAGDQAAIGAAAKGIGASCKGCHDKFKD